MKIIPCPVKASFEVRAFWMFEAITLEGCREVLKLLRESRAPTSSHQLSAFMFYLEDSVHDLKAHAGKICQDAIIVPLGCLQKVLNEVINMLRSIKSRVRSSRRDRELRKTLADELQDVLMTVETISLTVEQTSGSDPGPAGYEETGIEQWNLVVDEVLSDEESSDSDGSTSSAHSHLFSYLGK